MRDECEYSVLGFGVRVECEYSVLGLSVRVECEYSVLGFGVRVQLATDINMFLFNVHEIATLTLYTDYVQSRPVVFSVLDLAALVLV